MIEYRLEEQWKAVLEIKNIAVKIMDTFLRVPFLGTLGTSGEGKWNQPNFN